ncbi:hypothetical protein BJ170DRAFT_594703 [Xylariales sp. AK1849]|nr:hypothetical protein BJ170DRAFT_594703 [Xylariales sp. AK1849]
MAVHHPPRSYSPYGYLCAVCVLLCIIAPALTFYGRPSLEEYGYDFTSSLVEVITSPFSSKEENRDEYLAICLAVRNQGLDLPEFLQHHYYSMGIRRIYILDDGSEPPMSDFKDTYGVPQSALTFVYYNASERVGQMQYKVYNECAGIYGMNHTWLAFIDTDEFLDTPGGETVEEILRGLEPLDEVGALGINWQMHTSNGQLTRAESVRETYTQCIFDDPENNGHESDNKHVKTIVRTQDYGGPINPHMFHLAEGKITVGEDGEQIDHWAFRQPITRDRISLHHYAVKSRAEYEEKMARSNAMSQPKGWEFWEHVENGIPHIPCEDMLSSREYQDLRKDLNLFVRVLTQVSDRYLFLR